MSFMSKQSEYQCIWWTTDGIRCFMDDITVTTKNQIQATQDLSAFEEMTWSSTIINIGLTLQQFNLITHTSCFFCGGKIQGGICSKMPPCYDFKRLSR